MEKYGTGKFDPQAQRIVLGKENAQAFVDTINLAKEKYKQQVVEQISETREKIETPKWEVPIIISYNSKYTKEEKRKSIMKPFYTKKPSEPEKLFIELLENSEKVKWLFKNGENEMKYFAVSRKEDGSESSFYVDFIVQFEDGSVGLFDTKKGITAKDAKSRAEGLQKYIEEQKNKGKNLWGGIAILANGSWRYNDNRVYTYNENDLTAWKFLSL
jgi:type III restriction enzyme